jgi:hypothetical protein
MKCLLLLLLTVLASAAHAQVADTWQYRGIHLGTKMTPDQIMHAIGVTQYATNPKEDSIWDPKHADDVKHGIQWAIDKVEFDVGPRCAVTDAQNFDCRDPIANLHPSTPGGDNHGIVMVWVFVKNGVVHSIDLSFDSLLADAFFDVMFRQFGKAGWVQGQGETHIAITDMYDKTSIVVDRRILRKESSKYSVYVTDYDRVFTHYMPMYQGSFEMKVLDQQL